MVDFIVRYPDKSFYKDEDLGGIIPHGVTDKATEACAAWRNNHADARMRSWFRDTDSPRQLTLEIKSG